MTESQQKILDILGKRGSPANVKQIVIDLRHHGLNYAYHQVLNDLRVLAREAALTCEKGLWYAKTTVKSQVCLPDLSEESRRIIEGEKEKKPRIGGPWSTFRALLKYYAACIRAESGAEPQAYLTQERETFIFIGGMGFWYPHPKSAWSYSIFLNQNLSRFIRSLATQDPSNMVVMGYPIQVYTWIQDNLPPSSIIKPIFYVPLKWKRAFGAIKFYTENAEIAANPIWIQDTFRTIKDQKNFLFFCNLFKFEDVNENLPSQDYSELTPSYSDLVFSLSGYLGQRVIDRLTPESVPTKPIPPQSPSGIYNRAVIMICRRSRYNQGLLKELAEIAKLDDETLNETALRLLFCDDIPNNDNPVANEAHEDCVADVGLMLNPDQRAAANSLLQKQLTVVTGPPGTGKTQVISNVLANASFRDSCVLFSSRNHKAIDAVHSKVLDNQGQMFLIRTADKHDPGFKITFSGLVEDILARSGDNLAGHQFHEHLAAIRSLIEERRSTEQIAFSLAKLKYKSAEIQKSITTITEELPQDILKLVEKNPYNFSKISVQKIYSSVNMLAAAYTKQGNLAKIDCLWKGIRLAHRILACRFKLRMLPPLYPLPLPINAEATNQALQTLTLVDKASRLAKLYIEAKRVAEEVKKYPDQLFISQCLRDKTAAIIKKTEEALKLHSEWRRGPVPNTPEREILASIRNFIKEYELKGCQTHKALRERLEPIFQYAPCWTVTNLSVSTRIPLIPGLFDLAIIDEASQSDIPSAIPILFRARRLGVIGDPHQLKHVSTLSPSKDLLLMHESGLTDVGVYQFSYRDNSLYDLALRKRLAHVVLLRETYRSVEPIATYYGSTFYDGKLLIMTDLSDVKLPPNINPGIHWTEIEGNIESAGGGGCICKEESEKISEIVLEILSHESFRGTLGVVTPFRRQADRIKNIIAARADHARLSQSKFHVDTAHGFQGDERDIIFFSLCAGPEMPSGSLQFLRENGHLFNVGASRARVLLHMVGNRRWAKSCGIRHIENLAKDITLLRPPVPKGPWYPHESPWEKLLYEALVARGLKPHPQYHTLGRRLDLALISSNGFKLDVEVDGATYHQAPDGSRKIEDYWRDIQLQGAGWTVLRFWVHELKDDLVTCVDKILEVWRIYGEGECHQ